MSEEQVLNDEALIEMADQLKKTYDEITFKLDKLTLENLSLKKDITSAYGVARILDNLIDQCYDIPPEIGTLSDVLRAYLSNIMDTNIFNIKLSNP